MFDWNQEWLEYHWAYDGAKKLTETWATRFPTAHSQQMAYSLKVKPQL